MPLDECSAAMSYLRFCFVVLIEAKCSGTRPCHRQGYGVYFPDYPAHAAVAGNHPRRSHRQLDQIGVEKCKQPFPVLWNEQKKFFGIE